VYPYISIYCDHFAGADVVIIDCTVDKQCCHAEQLIVQTAVFSLNASFEAGLTS